MSEQLLKAIIHLLAIVAKEDNITADERHSIEQFLEENISRRDVDQYLAMFDKLTAEMLGRQVFDDKAEITTLADSVNLELTQAQKQVVMTDLLEMITADGRISAREMELVYFIGARLNIPKDSVDLMKNFVTATSASLLDNPNVLLATDTTAPPPASAMHITLGGLQGFIAILRLPGAERYFVKYLGHASLQLNGISLKNNRIQVFSHGSSIRCQLTKPLYYSDVVSKFRNEMVSTRISFEAHHLWYHFKNGKPGLQQINIAEEGGRLIGLMGGSGAGKSTLLNILNGTEAPSRGNVLINGIDIHTERRRIEGVIGYVPQDDLLIEELTVYQNLFYAARLCFGNQTNEQIGDLITKTLQALGLLEISGLKVGSPLQKTISGGQRKRLNIGLELLREPSVLFVDEPTSGLSSRDSENIMDLLKELSLKGKMVFAVIHQPSSEIFKMFDKLVILDVGGYQIYYGNPIDAVNHFRKMVRMVDTVQSPCVECGNVNPEQIFSIIETRVLDEYGQLTDQRKFQPADLHKFFTSTINIPKINTEVSLPEKTLRIPDKLRQTIIFTKRDIRSKLSNRQYLTINLLEAPLLAALLAYIVRYYPSGKPYSFYENQNIVAFFFMSVIVALFMGLTVSAEEIIKDRKILKRESFLHLSRLSYILSKLLILFSFSALQTLCYVLIGNWILEINGITLSYWMVLFSVSCFANVLGLNISSAFNSAITIYIIIPLILIPQLILSGAVVNFDKLNPHIANTAKVPLIGETMVSRWAFEAIAVEQFKNTPFTSRFYHYDKAVAEAEFKNLYWAARLETALEYCMQVTDREKESDAMESRLALLRNELGAEPALAGHPMFPEFAQLTVQDFDSRTGEACKRIILTIKKVYRNRSNKAFEEKDKLIQKFTQTPQEKEQYLAMKNKYENEGIILLAKNTSAEERVIEKDAWLVQKIYPAYSRPRPVHPFDFRTVFMAPEKHLLGGYFPTPYFNTAIIWAMSFLLIATLYFDIPQKIIRGISPGRAGSKRV